MVKMMYVVHASPEMSEYVCAIMYWNISLSRLKQSWLQFSGSQYLDKSTSFIYHVHLRSWFPFFLSLPLSKIYVGHIEKSL